MTTPEKTQKTQKNTTMEKFTIHYKSVPIIERLVYPKFIAAIVGNTLDAEIEMNESVYIASHIDAAIVEANEYLTKHYTTNK